MISGMEICEDGTIKALITPVPLGRTIWIQIDPKNKTIWIMKDVDSGTVYRIANIFHDMEVRIKAV